MCGVSSYASGRVAVCVNKINNYQSTFQFYEDNAKRTLLATLDEHAVRSRFAQHSTSFGSTLSVSPADVENDRQVGSAGRPGGIKLILSRDGGIITGGDDSIVKVKRALLLDATSALDLMLNDDLRRLEVEVGPKDSTRRLPASRTARDPPQWQLDVHVPRPQ